jgi:hypothetical protein
MVPSAARREAVAHLRTFFEVSERRACGVLGVDRTSCAIAAIGLTMRPCACAYANCRRSVAGSAIAISLS